MRWNIPSAAKGGSLALSIIACCIHLGAGCDPFTGSDPAGDGGTDARADALATDDGDAPKVDAGASDARQPGQRFVFVSDPVPSDFAGDASVDEAAKRVCEESVARVVKALGPGSPAEALVNRTWRAWLSDERVNAVDRVTDRSAFEWVNVKGEVVFPKGTLGDPATAIPARAFVKAGADPYSGQLWTGTVVDGTALRNAACGSWQVVDAEARGVVGSAMLRDAAAWSLDDVLPCTGARPIYCFEQ